MVCEEYFLFIRYKKMFSIVWKLIILYLCESNIEFYMRVKEIPILLLTGYLAVENDISEPYSF